MSTLSSSSSSSLSPYLQDLTEVGFLATLVKVGPPKLDRVQAQLAADVKDHVLRDGHGGGRAERPHGRVARRVGLAHLQ